MAARIKDAKYRVLKGVINLRREESDVGQAFFYVLFDPGNVHRLALRIMKTPEPAASIKHPWPEFCALLEETTSSPENADLEYALQEVVRQVLDNAKLVEIAPESPIVVQQLETRINASAGSAVHGVAHTFTKVEHCTTDSFHAFLAQFRPAESVAPGTTPTSPEVSDEAPSLGSREITLMCQPMVDPIRGKAAAAIQPGDLIRVKIPEESIFFSMLTKARGGLFDGVVEALVVRNERRNEDTVVLETALAENLKGMVPAPNALRIRLAAPEAAAAEAPAPFLVVGAVTGGTVLVGLLLWYFLM